MDYPRLVISEIRILTGTARNLAAAHAADFSDAAPGAVMIKRGPKSEMKVTDTIIADRHTTNADGAPCAQAALHLAKGIRKSPQMATHANLPITGEGRDEKLRI